MSHPDREQKQRYAAAREPYKLKYPQAKIHHLAPKSRKGPESEFNLFPWNEKSHSAWHNSLFPNMTVLEVWAELTDAHRLLFRTDQEQIVRRWCLPYLSFVNPSGQKDMLKPQSVERLREAWVTCFGSADRDRARDLLRYMLLFMVFGRHADDSREVYDSAWLRGMLQSLDGESDRMRAFRICFGVRPKHARLRLVKQIIRRVRSLAHTIPIR